MSEPETEKPSPESKPITSVVNRAARRPSQGIARRAPGDPRPAAADGAKPAVPGKPDGAKVAALAVCGLLFVACLGVLLYILAFKPKAVVKSGIDKLSPAARALAEKADRAKKLYEDGKAKASSDKLDDLEDSEKNLFDALTLFNEVADENKTVPGYEDTIRTAHDKKLVIDAELKEVRDKKFKLEQEADNARREKSKAAQTDKPAAAAPAEPGTFGKEPTDEEMSDKNLDRLFNDDPSEYDRIAKFREKKDPAFKAKKP